MADETFPTDTAGVAPSTETPLVELSDGDEFDLRIAPVTKEIDGETVRMLAYNRSIPGPTLRVKQGSELVVNVVNEGDLEATVHWHGLRLDNRYDGTHETQAPIPVGGSFTYRIEFPDPGLYWYHPHIRQDYGQELGLYGNILVEPAQEDYWPPVHREVVLTLDDILLEEGQVAPFSRSGPSYVAMGRFGTTLLVGGETEASLDARQGEVVRFYLTNTANTRVFRVGVTGGRVKLVGLDSGHVEAEELVDDVVLAPSERVVVDVLFDTSGKPPSSTARPTVRTAWPRSPSRRRPPSRSAPTSTPCGRTPTSSPSGSGSAPTSRPSQTRRSPSSPRWTWARRPRARRASSRVRCTRRSSPPGRASAPSAG